jgi:hypothetical protein
VRRRISGAVHRANPGSAPGPNALLTRVNRINAPHRLARNHQELFEEELNGWYTDPALWPGDRSHKMLREWCSFELHIVVVDTGESPLEDDGFDE